MTVRLTASDFYTFFSPSKCELRVYLKHIGKTEAPAGPYEEVLFRLGERHEAAHLATFPEYIDLSKGHLEEREKKTREAVELGAPLIYQAVLVTAHKLHEGEYEILGEPDFLIRHQNGYIIRDSKISRRITEKDHPEILRQLEIYGWLYEKTLGIPLKGLQVHSGPGDIIEVNYDGGIAALSLFKDIASMKTAKAEIYSPVGWSKCGGCPFYGYCWPRAEANRDVALIYGVDQNLAAALKEQGITTVEELLRHFDEESLAEFQRPWGNRMQRVGKKALSIIRMARAMSEKKEIMIQLPSIPDYPNYVMFDLEGLPSQLDELEKIYLWGMKVFGEDPSDFIAAIAGFGEDGDRKGWDSFLNNAVAIFERYGDIPFVHWHQYERVKIDLYLERYGDRNGIAERVKNNLLDILPVTQGSIALPIPSYSLKVVEKYVGFKRTLDDVAGDWAMAKYIEATEIEDRKQRDDLMGQILTYNREDLEATWAVFQWLKSKMG
jgi:predicted RecB family nuclease